MNVSFDNKITEAFPNFMMIKVEADVDNCETSEELWNELLAEGERIKSLYPMEMVNKRPGIMATRQSYKTLGKEPNRYRPSSEALCRRVVKGMELYRINALVDLINIISMRSGYSIGGFDLDKVEGDCITLGVGAHEEPFEAIGRGPLNIEFLPVYRDNVGGIGTPTSDNERTKISIDTKRLLMTINIYGEEMPCDECIEYTTQLITKHANARNIQISVHKTTE
ncbi:MAG: hypothetical protein IKY35_01940 [Muribaculaceae bacterium]|nr:hypothetical protein [Muribaculaceae bacterium]